MIHATMFINTGVEVNLARRALQMYMSDEDARALIPSEGGYIANLFNNERGRDVDAWIEAIHSAIHENRERYHQMEHERKARAQGKMVCGNCNAAVKPRMARTHTTWGNAYEQETCPNCGATLD